MDNTYFSPIRLLLACTLAGLMAPLPSPARAETGYVSAAKPRDPYEARREKMRHKVKPQAAAPLPVPPPGIAPAAAPAGEPPRAETPRKEKKTARKVSVDTARPRQMKVHIPNPEAARQVTSPAAVASLTVLDSQIMADTRSVEKQAEAQPAPRQPSLGAFAAADALTSSFVSPPPAILAATESENATDTGVAGASATPSDEEPGLAQHLFNAVASPISESIEAAVSVLDDTRHVVATAAAAIDLNPQEPPLEIVDLRKPENIPPMTAHVAPEPAATQVTQSPEAEEELVPETVASLFAPDTPVEDGVYEPPPALEAAPVPAPPPQPVQTAAAAPVLTSPDPVIIVHRSTLDLTGRNPVRSGTTTRIVSDFAELAPAAGEPAEPLPPALPAIPLPNAAAAPETPAPVDPAHLPAVPIPPKEVLNALGVMAVTTASNVLGGGKKDPAAPTAPAAPAGPAPVTPSVFEASVSPAPTPVPVPEPKPPAETKEAKKPKKGKTAEEQAEPETVPVILPSEDSTEPVPALNPLTKKTLARIPSNLDQPEEAGTQHLTLERKKEKPAATASSGGGPDAPPELEGAAVEEKALPIDVKVDVRKPSVDVQYELERAYNALLLGDSEAAVQLYNNVLLNDPNNKQALFGMGATYHRIGQLEKARPYYGRLLKLEPTNREALNNFLALAADEAPQETLNELQLLQKKNPNFSPIPAQMAYIYQKLNMQEQAIDQMVRAVELSPENITYRYNLAVMFDKAGKAQEAVKLYKQILEANFRGETIPGNITRIQQRLTFLSSNRQ